METNWNQLIERYLQNELSEEGRNAFEQELQINPELREELELHRLIQSAAKRASQRGLVQQAGKNYLRNLRIKQFAAGMLIAGAIVAGMVYWIKSSEQQNEPHPSASARVSDAEQEDNTAGAENSAELVTADSLVQVVAGNAEINTSASRTTFVLRTAKNPSSPGQSPKKDASGKGQFVSLVIDSTVPPRPTVAVLGFTNEKLNGKVIEKESPNMSSSSRETNWYMLYDSVGKFNDLYCGYALVMSNAKFGFVDRQGKVFIPLTYDQIVVTVNIKSSKHKNRRLKKKKILYIPKRSGSEVRDCEEDIHPFLKTDSLFLREKK